MLSRPVLRPDCLGFYDAYRLLGGTREWTQVGPVPFSLGALKECLEIVGLDHPAILLRGVRLLQRMDQTECAFHRENLSRAKK